MSLTRNKIKEILSTAGVDGEHMDAAITAILDGHTASVDALREERDTYKKAADELPEVKKSLEEYKKNAGKGDPYEEKYNALKTEYDTYKKDVTAKETTAKKQDAYKELLKDAGVDSKRYGAILKVTDLSKAELDKEGKFKDADKLKESIKKDWADFIVTEGKEGAKTSTPPAGKGTSSMTKEDIMKIKDTSERQAAIAENHELFGF